MKNKPLTIILLFAVVAIWAWIMYSVVDYMKSPEVYVANKKKIVSVMNEDTITSDYVLVLNYKDPFLKKEYIRKSKSQFSTNNHISSNSITNNYAIRRNKTKESIKKEELPVPVVNYVGRIQNAKLKKPVAIVLIDNKEYMMQEGELKDGILLKQILNDSLKVMFLKKVFYVKKQ